LAQRYYFAFFIVIDGRRVDGEGGDVETLVGESKAFVV
jgi:hypothetical protein